LTIATGACLLVVIVFPKVFSMRRSIALLASLFFVLLSHAALAWNSDGHQIVGAIADESPQPNAKQKVSSILGVDLRTAAPWLDCVMSVHRLEDGSLKYIVEPRFEAPCTPFAQARNVMEECVRHASGLLPLAQQAAKDTGRVENWSFALATDTMEVAPQAFAGATFAKVQPSPAHPRGGWSIAFADHAAYSRARDDIKRQQMAKAGARLSNLLNKIWP
jgi:hypothetical protein